jgi:hypothetical protein
MIPGYSASLEGYRAMNECNPFAWPCSRLGRFWAETEIYPTRDDRRQVHSNALVMRVAE